MAPSLFSSLFYSNFLSYQLCLWGHREGLRQVSSSIPIRLARSQGIQYIITPTVNIISSIPTCPQKSDFVEPPWGKGSTVKDAHQTSGSFFLRHSYSYPLWLSGGHMTSARQRIVDATRVISKQEYFIDVAWGPLSSIFTLPRDPDNGSAFCLSPQPRIKLRGSANL